MALRLLLLISILCGLAVGPVGAVATCDTQECMSCCAGADAICCASSDSEVPEAPAAVSINSIDLKQAVVPVQICLGLQPGLVMPPVSVQQRSFAQRPVQARLDVTCIRLI